MASCSPLELLFVLRWRKFDLTENLANEWTRQVTSGMTGHSRRASIGVFIEDMTAALADVLESEPAQQGIHPLEVNDGQAAHPAISICCTPTKRGRSSTVSPSCSRHSSSTSRRLFRNSSSVAPCVWAPVIPGTIPT